MVAVGNNYIRLYYALAQLYVAALYLEAQPGQRLEALSFAEKRSDVILEDETFLSAAQMYARHDGIRALILHE